ncbi:MAG: hypothetical protein EA391_00675 [Balneolaceae bacterium]|nr:MAG: hypothetical protein EA391_00675 [Balneolaceae bacterium]
MIKTAFIVKDHKTYMNAEEAWFRFKKEKNGSLLFILIPLGDPANVVDTLKESINDEFWSNVIWFKSFSNYDSKTLKIKKKKFPILNFLLNNIEYLFNRIDTIRLNLLAKRTGTVDAVFSGHRNTQEHLAACLKPKEHYILDSGQTLDKIRPSGYIDYRYSYYSSRIKKLMLKFTGLKIAERKNVALFTVYADSAKTRHKLVRNNQVYKKHLLSTKEKGDQVVFISSPFYRFKPTISLDTYIEYIERIISELNIDRKKLIYVPNPIRETEEDIAKIIKRLGCQCDDRLLTVEAKVAAYDKIPAMCVSPSSTALVNIDVVAEGKIEIISAWHPEFNCFRFLVDWRKSVENDKNRTVKFVEIPGCPPLFNIDLDKYENSVPFNNFNDV